VQIIFDAELAFDAKYGPLAEGTLSAFVVVVTLGMIVAMWTYMLALYRAQALVVFLVFYQTFSAVLASGYIFSLWKIEARFQGRLIRRVVAQFGLFVAWVAISYAALHASLLRFSWSDLVPSWWRVDIVIRLLGAVGMLLLYRWRVSRITQKRNPVGSHTQGISASVTTPTYHPLY
jgi:hypothetical protein